MKKTLAALGLFALTAALGISAGAAMPQEFSDAGFTEKELPEAVIPGNAAIDYGYYDNSCAPIKDYYEVGDGYVTIEAEDGNAEITLHNADYTGSGNFIKFIVDDDFEVTLNVEGTNTINCAGNVIDIGMYGWGADENTLIFSGTGSLDYPDSSAMSTACRVIVESGTYSANYLSYCAILDINGGSINCLYLSGSSETVVNLNDPTNVNGTIIAGDHYIFCGNIAVSEDDILELYKSDVFIPGTKITVDGILVFPDDYTDYDSAMADYGEIVSGNGIVLCGSTAYTMDGKALHHILFNLPIDYDASSSGEYWDWNSDTKTLTLDGNLVIYGDILFYGDYEENEVTVIVNGNVYVGEDLEFNYFGEVTIDVKGYMYVEDDINSYACRKMAVKGGGILDVDDEIEVVRDLSDHDTTETELPGCPEGYEDEFYGYDSYTKYYLLSYDSEISPAVLTIEEGTWLLTDEEMDVDKLVVNGMLYVEDTTYPAVEVNHSLIIGKKGGFLAVNDSYESDPAVEIIFLNCWNLPEDELTNLKGYRFTEGYVISEDDDDDEGYTCYYLSKGKLISVSEIIQNYRELAGIPEFDLSMDAVISGNFITHASESVTVSEFFADAAAMRRLLMQKHTFTLESSEGGSITGKTKVNHFMDVTYTIEADEGYVLTALYVDSKEVEPAGTISFKRIDKPHSIKAVFTPAE